MNEIIKRKVRDHWADELGRLGWYHSLKGQEVKLIRSILKFANWETGLYFPGVIRAELECGVNRCHVNYIEWKLFHYGLFDRWGYRKAQRGEMRILKVAVPPPECDSGKVDQIRRLCFSAVVDNKRGSDSWKQIIIYDKDKVLSTTEQEKGGLLSTNVVELPVFTSYTREFHKKGKDIDSGKDRKEISTTPEPEYEDPKKLIDKEKDKEVRDLLKKTQAAMKEKADKIG